MEYEFNIQSNLFLVACRDQVLIYLEPNNDDRVQVGASLPRLLLCLVTFLVCGNFSSCPSVCLEEIGRVCMCVCEGRECETFSVKG